MRLVTRPFRAYWDALKGLSELRRTPYGITPVLVLSLIGLGATFDTTLFSIGSPQFLRRGDVSVNQIIDIVAYVSLLVFFNNLWVGWLADRTRRVPFVGIGTMVGALPTGLTGL